MPPAARLFARALPALFLCLLVTAAGCRPPNGGENTAGPPLKRPVAPLFDPELAPTLLDEPGRDEWQQPQRIVRALRLRQGDVVADIGAGSGYLLPHLSRAVGASGRVYAQEIQGGFLPPLRRHARTLPNVRVVLGTAGDPRLPPGGADCFVLLTVYHEVQRPVAFLQTLRGRYAKPGARLAIIDFDDNRHGRPPAPSDHWALEKDVLAEARAAGWELVERHEFLSSQFFLVFRPAAGRAH